MLALPSGLAIVHADANADPDCQYDYVTGFWKYTAHSSAHANGDAFDVGGTYDVETNAMGNKSSDSGAWPFKPWASSDGDAYGTVVTGTIIYADAYAVAAAAAPAQFSDDEDVGTAECVPSSVGAYDLDLALLCRGAATPPLGGGPIDVWSVAAGAVNDTYVEWHRPSGSATYRFAGDQVMMDPWSMSQFAATSIPATARHVATGALVFEPSLCSLKTIEFA